MSNNLVELHAYGQSFWYDNIRRQLLLDGTLAGLIEDDGSRGMTSNPSIFDKAIGSGDDYDQQLAELAEAGHSITDIYETLALADTRLACDMFALGYMKLRSRGRLCQSGSVPPSGP
ncbi:MAG: transaldolase family protein [Chloroflexota bacterium]